MAFIDTLLGKCEIKASQLKLEQILISIVGAVIHTYDKPVMHCLEELDGLEEQVFSGGSHQRKFSVRRGYLLKRKASVFKRMLRVTVEPLNSMMRDNEISPSFRNVREHIDSIYFYADEVTDTLESLLNLHVSLSSQKTNEASQRTNEVMRVLTIFSVFFMPINFIASLYGMNFEWMPELKSPHGYPIVISAMGFIVIILYFWMRRRGWLKS